MTMIPKKIKQVSPSELFIEWSDGHKGKHTMPVLRRYCPCASCKTEIEASEQSTLLPIISQGQYELKSIEQVGSYALQVQWGDGHRTGIYTFDHLRQICECEECARTSAE